MSCEQYVYYRKQEIEHVEKVLNGIGVEIKDENGYFPVNEVMISVAKELKNRRETWELKEYEIAKDNVLLALLGQRFKYELS